jgi:hypothetical protein
MLFLAIYFETCINLIYINHLSILQDSNLSNATQNTLFIKLGYNKQNAMVKLKKQGDHLIPRREGIAT